MSLEHKKQVFISYGHKDGFDFVRRFSFSLELYLNVFWDKKLRVGAFDTQLYSEIERCDYLVMVMTPYALRENGWCRIELEYAHKHNKPIVPIKLHDSCGFDALEQELEQNQYADFRKSFDAGFQQLTQILLGNPHLSWEFFTHFNDEDLLKQLDSGRIPKIIADELAEWILVNKAWSMIEYDVTQRNVDVYMSSPKTILGVARCCNILVSQGAIFNDAILVKQAMDVQEVIKEYLKNPRHWGNTETINSNKATAELAQKIYKLNLLNTYGNFAVQRFKEIEGFYYFEVAEKLRELINLHARRSRYLY